MTYKRLFYAAADSTILMFNHIDLAELIEISPAKITRENIEEDMNLGVKHLFVIGRTY
ncbi:MAG: hypothetical protein O8C64_03530 [Candidatus Methanoperedens sp.]|nr:hypothetical protein [Candidatus Methanoperedens sp.]MCZ7405653.1 hypothetical protein [Candidatus Methanoperedens sp.]